MNAVNHQRAWRQPDKTRAPSGHVGTAQGCIEQGDEDRDLRRGDPARGATGAITSAVDVHDPAWNPREYNPLNGRWVRTDPPALAGRVFTADTHERLMSITADVQVHVQPTAIFIDDHSTALPGPAANYVAGSVIHHYQGHLRPGPSGRSRVRHGGSISSAIWQTPSISPR